MIQWEYQNRLAMVQQFRHLASFCEGYDRAYHVHGSFGDIYCQLSAIRESLHDSPANESVLVLVDPRYTSLTIDALDGFNYEFRAIDANGLNILLTQNGILGLFEKLPVRMLPSLYPIIPELISRNLLNYIDFFRFLAKSNRSGPLEYIEKDHEPFIFSSQITKPGKSVIICPDTATHRQFSPSLWEVILTELYRMGLTPILNVSSGQGSILRNIVEKFPEIEQVVVRPEIAVSLTKYAGFYLGGSIGFLTVQSFFNRQSYGVHLINAIDSPAGYSRDSNGNLYSLSQLSWQTGFPKQFVGRQLDIEVRSEDGGNELADRIVRYFTEALDA